MLDSNITTINPDTTSINQTGKKYSAYQRELVNALNDPSIDKYYKEIYNQEKLISTDEIKMLSITDSLFTLNPDNEFFYFVVFTKSMNGSDGFYAEAMGISAFKFVTTRTIQFADYFYMATCLTDYDLDIWAKNIYGEIQIS